MKTFKELVSTIWNKMFGVVLLSLIMCFVSGCATMISGRTQSVKILSDPPGAEVHVGGIVTTTPASVDLVRNDVHTVIVSKEGYTTEAVNLHRGINPTWWLDIFIGGPPICLLPMLYDTSTGADASIMPKEVSVALSPDSSGKSAVPNITPVLNLNNPISGSSKGRICVYCACKVQTSFRIMDGDYVVGIVDKNTYLSWERPEGRADIVMDNGERQWTRSVNIQGGAVQYLSIEGYLSPVPAGKAKEAMTSCRPISPQRYIITQY